MKTFKKLDAEYRNVLTKTSWLLVVLFLLNLCWTITTVFPTKLVGEIINGIQCADKKKLMTLLRLYVGIRVVSLVISVLSRYVQERYRVNVEMQLRELSVKKVLLSDLDKNKHSNSTELVLRIVEASEHLVKTLISIVNWLGKSLMTLVITYYFIFTISFEIFLILIPLSILMAAITNTISNKMKKVYSRSAQSNESASRFMREIFDNLMEVKSYSAEEWFLRKYQREEDDKRKNALKYNIFSISNFWVLNFFGIVVCALILFSGFNDTRFVKLNPGDITALLLYSGSIFYTLMEVFEQVVLLKTLDVKVDRLVDVLNFDIKGKNRYVSKADPVIEVNHVSHKFKNKWVFKDISMRIPFNSKIAIIGETGSGKSTLALLMAGIYEPVSGDVTINGENVYSTDFSDTHVMCSVFQHVSIFHASIKENITLGKPYSEERLREVLEITCCKTFVDKLKDGLETKLSEGGNTLSGGEIQRIGLARALMLQPKILILDEVSSALDENTERKINNKLFAMDQMTIISVTHRKNTIDFADKCFEMHNGKLDLKS